MRPSGHLGCSACWRIANWTQPRRERDLRYWRASMVCSLRERSSPRGCDIDSQARRCLVVVVPDSQTKVRSSPVTVRHRARDRFWRRHTSRLRDCRRPSGRKERRASQVVSTGIQLSMRVQHDVHRSRARVHRASSTCRRTSKIGRRSTSRLPYLLGWLSGYFAADGCVASDGTVILNSSDRENLEFVRQAVHALGDWHLRHHRSDASWYTGPPSLSLFTGST